MIEFPGFGKRDGHRPFFLSDPHSLGACCLKRRCGKHGRFSDKIVGIFVYRVYQENIAKTEFVNDKIHFLRLSSQIIVVAEKLEILELQLRFLHRTRTSFISEWIGDKLEITKITFD